MTIPRLPRRGDRVRLKPHGRGDVFDIALVGRIARVASIEEDFEGKLHVAVLLDDDPGHDIGPRRPGSRFFFAPDELECLDPENDDPEPAGAPTSVLVAGIGNIFLGDDAFGVEVVQRLALDPPTRGVLVADYGIRGLDLAYALMGTHDHVVLVDACPRGGAPGTISVMELDLDDVDAGDPPVADGHDMNPVAVLRLARAMGATRRSVLLVGCEPASLSTDPERMGLSEPVEAAVGEALRVIRELVGRLQRGDPPVPVAPIRPPQNGHRTPAKSRRDYALERLSNRDREVLMLWEAGLGYAEIAELAQLDVTLVGVTLARAERHLLAAFHEETRGTRRGGPSNGASTGRDGRGASREAMPIERAAGDGPSRPTGHESEAPLAGRASEAGVPGFRALPEASRQARRPR